jgi:hypothetical protein
MINVSSHWATTVWKPMYISGFIKMKNYFEQKLERKMKSV